ncbi:MAG: BatD family protein [Candidatus Omnitrophota bacterium]
MTMIWAATAAPAIDSTSAISPAPFAAARVVSASSSQIEDSLKPDVEARVDRNDILIGDNIRLAVSITHDPSVSILERNEALNLGQFELKEVNPAKEETLADGKKRRSIEYVISTYFTGEFTIPSFAFRFKTEDGRIGEIDTPSIKINVRSLTPEESEGLDIRDIKTPVVIETPGRMLLLSLIALGALDLILILVFCWRFLRQLYPKREVVEYVPPGQAHERALAALGKLRQNKELIEQGKCKEFSTILSDIVRLYIYRRWSILAMDFTTSEILRELRGVALEKPALDLFQDVIEECDLIKFAKYEPPVEELEKLIRDAEAVVEQTKLQEGEESAGPVEEKPKDERPPSLFSSFWGALETPAEVKIGAALAQAAALFLVLNGIASAISSRDWTGIVQAALGLFLFWFGRGLSFGYRIAVSYIAKDAVFSCIGLALIWWNGFRFESFLLLGAVMLFLATPIVFAYLNWDDLH